jgi:uncharacterized protein (DUF3820 family)
MSSYFQSLTSHLHGEGLLTDELKAALLEHDDAFESKSSIRMPFGAHKGKTLREIHAFKPSYIDWLCKQSYVKDKFTEIYEEAKQLQLLE